jgi:hypothetical protein
LVPRALGWLGKGHCDFNDVIFCDSELSDSEVRYV